MAVMVVQDLSLPVKVYVVLLHLLLLLLVVLFLRRPYKRKDSDKEDQSGRKSRTFTKDNRAVTIEPCEWLNSTLAWFYLHAQGKDRTPNIVKLWIRALNKQLQKDRKVRLNTATVYFFLISCNFKAKPIFTQILFRVHAWTRKLSSRNICEFTWGFVFDMNSLDCSHFKYL